MPTTRVNVSLGSSGLIRRNSGLLKANRQSLSRAIDSKNIQTTATIQRKIQSGISSNPYSTVTRSDQGISNSFTSRSRYIADEIAAFTRKERKDFGWFDTRGLVFPPEDTLRTQENKITSFDELENYKVVQVFMCDTTEPDLGGLCILNTPGTLGGFFANEPTFFYNFILNGGVLLINNEYSSCGDPNFSSYISTYFNSSIVVNYDLLNVQGSGSLVYTSIYGTGAQKYYYQATATVSGGTPLYADDLTGQIICAFERIGSGCLVVTGDSNASTGYPWKKQFYDFPPQSKNFYDTLITLSSL